MVIDKKIADYIISELSPVVNFDINLKIGRAHV